MPPLKKEAVISPFIATSWRSSNATALPAELARPRRRPLALGGENAERQSDLGEALAAVSNGIVTAEAKAAFERALVLDPNDLKARFYIGLAAEQDGDRAKAAAVWRGMLENAPADAP